MVQRPVLIGIAGPSAAGKSTASEVLQRKLKKATIISVDNYWKDPAGFRNVKGVRQLRGWKLWEHPENIDFDLLHKNLSELKRGEETKIPIRIPDPVHNIITMQVVQPKGIIIVEGMLLFYEERIRRLFDICIYLDIPEDVSGRRRSRRNRAGGEGNELYFRRVVVPSFRRYGKPTKRFAHLIVDATRPVQEVVASIMRRIRHFFDPLLPQRPRRAHAQSRASKRERKQDTK